LADIQEGKSDEVRQNPETADMVLYEPIGGSETDSPLDCLVESDALPVVLAYPGRILWADDVAGETHCVDPGQNVDPGQSVDPGQVDPGQSVDPGQVDPRQPVDPGQLVGARREI
jgi:hypothetical protein